MLYKVSFKFVNIKYASLFTAAGKMLEVYTYYEACNTGFFDDVISGLKFKWILSEAENELDCVLTHGFQSIVIECKDRKEIKAEFIHKIDSVASHFGLGTHKVLILTRSRRAITEADRAYNTKLIERCKAMGVTLIMGDADILNLGKRLVSILKEDK